MTKILTLAALVGTGLMGGVAFSFGVSIMGALDRMPAGQGAAAMNLINARIQNPLFLLAFMGTAFVCLALVVLSFVRDTPGRWWQLAGALLYLFGMIVMTFAVNVPLNDHLATIDPTSAAGAAEWQAYLAKWNPANNLRALLCALGVVAFGMALASGSGKQTAVKETREAWPNVQAQHQPQYQEPHYQTQYQPQYQPRR